MSTPPGDPLPQVAGPLRLLPFQALRLSPSRVADPASARAFARPYSDVPARLSRWEQQGQILRDAYPALYLHEYTSGGLTVRGLVGALDLTQRTSDPAQRVILPHEAVGAEHAAELAVRMSAMHVNPAPILLVHRAEVGVRSTLREVVEEVPDHQFLDRARQRHRIWGIRDEDRLRRIDAGLAAGRALVADGHHRYAAYLRMQQRNPGTAADSGLAMLVDQGDTPLFVGAIHRVLSGISVEQFLQAAERVALPVTELDERAALGQLGPDHIVVTDAERWVVMSLDLPVDRAAIEFLHQTLLPALPHPPARISFRHSVEETLRQVAPRHDVAVLLPAPDVDLVLRVARRGRLLPEKATSFQPKPSLGAFIRSLDDSAAVPT